MTGPDSPEPFPEEEDPQKIATGMTLADISIRNHVFAWILMIGLIGFGLLTFTGYGDVMKGIGISQNPDVDFPVVNVSITYEGASPEIMETDIVDIVEDAVTSAEGVREVTSTSRQGQANVTVEFDLERNIDAALQDVQTRVAQAARRMPREIDPPVITKNNPEDQPILRLGLAGDRSATWMADYVQNVLRPQFQTVPGVGEVSLQGYRERNVRVWVDAVRLESQGLTFQDVIRAIQREHLEVPAGRIETPDREMNVRAEGEALDLTAFRSLVVSYKEGAPVRLEDVAVVEDGLEDRRRISRSNGEPSLGIGIQKLRGSNAVDVGRGVNAKLEEIRRQLPEGLALNVTFDTTTYIERAIQEILFTLVLAAVLTGLVCWLFLGSWSSTVNIVMAIPTSILGTFIVIYFFGFTLNTFTLLGLTLVVGIVVDDAIMVLENIYRHREEGKGKVRAASDGAREITFAAAATTAAIVAIFLPVAFMKGIIGKFFFQFGVTISVAVLLSLLEALTLAPMRCSRFLEVGERRGRLGAAVDRSFAALARAYLRALEPALHHRAWVMLGALLLFVLSLGIIPRLRQEFVPSQDSGRFGVRFMTPVGTSIDVTDRAFQQLEEFASGRPEVDRYMGFIGGFGGGEVNSGFIFLMMKDLKDRPPSPETGRPLTQQEFMNVMRRAGGSIPGIRVSVQDFSQTGFSASRGFPIEISIRGRDWDTLAQKSSEIMASMRESGLVTDVDSDYRIGMPEVQVIPTRNKAADLGVSMAAMGETVNAAIGGARVAKFKDKGRRYDIRVRLLASQRQKPEDIERLLVRSQNGSLVRMGDVVRIEQRPSLQAITRRDRERAITIFGNPAPGASQAEAIRVSLAAAQDILPAGYRAIASGTSKTFQESFQSLGFALLMGIIVAYMVLASQFNAFTHPFTVLLALPFSASGALLALWIGGQSLNIYSFLGLILLMGISKKNSILLVDFTNQIRARGVERHQAILEACPIRLRPILMTSTAMIAGALPPALAIGPGAELQKPMAIAMVGGILVSTLLTLFVVPAAYSVIDDAVVWNEARRKRGTGFFAGVLESVSRRPRTGSTT
jgi:hydrophobe/amphiphile efflux-1 (HAE1) family protein